ncbi:hypothetical protein [Mycetocola lacteus]|nr:hypothetical protein [Mycetocola lacteus]
MTRIKYAGLSGRLAMLGWSVVVLVFPAFAPASNPVTQHVTWIIALVLCCMGLISAALIGVYVTRRSVVMIGLTRVSVFPLETLERFGTVHTYSAFRNDVLWNGLVPTVTVTGGGRTRSFVTNVHFARHSAHIVAQGRTLINQRRVELGVEPLAGQGWDAVQQESAPDTH